MAYIKCGNCNQVLLIEDPGGEINRPLPNLLCDCIPKELIGNALGIKEEKLKR